MNSTYYRARRWFIVIIILLAATLTSWNVYQLWHPDQTATLDNQDICQPCQADTAVVPAEQIESAHQQSEIPKVENQHNEMMPEPEPASVAMPIAQSALPADPYGYRLGFTSIAGEYKYKKLPYSGTIPSWLNGSFVAVGPGKFEINEHCARTWLDGFAMVHRFSFKNGNVSYANKFIESIYYTDSVAKGKISDLASAGDPNASYFSKLAAAMSNSNNRPPYDNTNLNVINHNHTWLALTETPQPIIFDRHTLTTKGLAGFDDEHKPHVASAHPFIDNQTGELINVMTTYGRSKSTYTIFTMKPKSFVRTPLTTFTTGYPSYIHSFAVTKDYILLIEIPFVVNPYDLVMSGKPYIFNFQWKPKQATKISIVKRSTGKQVGSIDAPPFFALHYVNAFQKDDGTIILDVAAHKDASMIHTFGLCDIHQNNNHTFSQAQLIRLTLKPGSDMATQQILSSQALEMPRINPDFKTKEYSFVYALGSADKDHYFDRLVKINVADGSQLAWQQPGCYPAEPTFVAAPHAKSEDDGILLSIVLDAAAKKSFLLLLDAKTMKEIARVPLTHHIPFVVHGNYFAKPTTLHEQLEEQFKIKKR